MIHIDIDPAEIGKNRQPDVPIVGDVATVLDDLIPEIQRTQAIQGKPNLAPWWKAIDGWREEYPMTWDERPTDRWPRSGSSRSSLRWPIRPPSG